MFGKVGYSELTGGVDGAAPSPIPSAARFGLDIELRVRVRGLFISIPPGPTSAGLVAVVGTLAPGMSTFRLRLLANAILAAMYSLPEGG